MTDFSRTQRIGDQIQRELGGLVQLEMKDPRLGIVTINAVEVSRDLAYAEVYVTRLGEDDEDTRKKTIEILTHAGGFLRSRLAKMMQLRKVPVLRFHYDESVARGHRLSALIDKAVKQDQAMSGLSKKPDEDS